jgi:hypothetical protein
MNRFLDLYKDIDPLNCGRAFKDDIINAIKKDMQTFTTETEVE